jgi:hypothetical protein
MEKSTFLYISPDNSENLIFNSHVRHYLPIPLKAEPNEKLYMEVVALSIPNSMYVINDRNDEINFTESEEDGTNPSSYSIVLTHGNYEGEELMTMITSLLHDENAEYIEYLLTIDENTYLLTISTTTLNRKAVFTFEQWELLGMGEEENIMTSTTPLIGTKLINLNHDLAFYIRSPLVSLKDKVSHQNILHYETISERKFVYIHKGTASHPIMINTDVLTSVEIKITDEDEKILDFNGLYWEIVIKVSVVENPDIFSIKRKKEEEYAKKKESYIKGIIVEFVKAFTILLKPIQSKLSSIDKEITRQNLSLKK